MPKIELIQGDCLEKMKGIPDGSIDMILCDLPYGTTACKWDIIIPFEHLWEKYKRIIKDNGAIVLTASQPFTSALVMSNIKMFKYSWVWKKSRKTGFQMARLRPMKEHEDVLVFYQKQPTYNQSLIKLNKPIKSWRKNGKGGNLLNEVKTDVNRVQEWTGFNTDILEISSEHNANAHPTQKPVALFEYLIKTYTNEGDLVLDNCMGSGTTGVACKNTGRNFIGIELDQTYFNIAEKRINENL
jgi:site-specific DNA-methyltransferase (adenine-specific)